MEWTIYYQLSSDKMTWLLFLEPQEKKSFTEVTFGHLIFWAQCDALNQSLDGSAGRLCEIEVLVDFQTVQCGSSVRLSLSANQSPESTNSLRNL